MKTILRILTFIIKNFKIFRYQFHLFLRRFPENIALIQHKAEGITFDLDLREEVDFLIFTDPNCNAHELAFIREHLSPKGIFLDIGANIGYFSLIVARSFPDVRVYAFEPDSFSCRKLEKNIINNSISNISLEKYAISNTKGIVRFCINEKGNRGGSGIVLKSVPESEKIIDVPAIRLIDFCLEKGLDHIDCVKLDMEGHEFIAMNAFFATAPRSLWPKAIVTEEFGDHIQGSGGSIIQLLITSGYDLVDHTAFNFFLVLRNNTEEFPGR